MKQAWLDRKEYPFHSNYYAINGHSLHYLDEGKGEPILFVHGTPSWSFDFRKVIQRLKPDFRCLAIDHMGFGLSDKPEQYDYTTQQHAATLTKFILDLQLSNLTLVLHDFGGPIGMQVAMQYPQLIQRIVILNSWLWSSESDPEFIKLRRILKNPIMPWLYKLNFSARFILPGSFGDHKLSQKLLRQYTKPFSKRSERYGTLGFLKSLINDQDWFESLWSRRAILASKPMLLIWGMKDPVIKPGNLQKFQSGFPQAEVIKVETAGHFPQEEQPEVVAEAILNFMHSTPGGERYSER